MQKTELQSMFYIDFLIIGFNILQLFQNGEIKGTVEKVTKL